MQGASNRRLDETAGGGGRKGACHAKADWGILITDKALGCVGGGVVCMRRAMRANYGTARYVCGGEDTEREDRPCTCCAGCL